MPFKREDGFAYVEPFVGGGALLFWMLENFPNLDKAIVNDINPNLIHTYKTIRDHPADLIERLCEMEKGLNSIFDNSGKASLTAKKRVLYYVQKRERFNQVVRGERAIGVDHAANFIFLNKVGWNGLYRVNGSGEFNVPAGDFLKLNEECREIKRELQSKLKPKRERAKGLKSKKGKSAAAQQELRKIVSENKILREKYNNRVLEYIDEQDNQKDFLKTFNIYSKDRLGQVSHALSKVELITGDYKETLSYASSNAFYYLDPPYKPVSETSHFNSYSEGGFGDKNQEELRRYCDQLDGEGAKFLLSNSDVKTETVEEGERDFFDRLYEGYEVCRIKAARSINSLGDERGKIKELLVCNYPKSRGGEE